jgi:hypothetical protein
MSNDDNDKLSKKLTDLEVIYENASSEEKQILDRLLKGYNEEILKFSKEKEE